MSASIAERQHPFRPSTDTDRRHLLSESLAPSEISSRATSVRYDDDGDRTPRATSPVRAAAPRDTLHRHASIASPEQAHSQAPYRGFSSEKAYLEALQAWADGKRYEVPSNNTLIGFYGTTTMEEYASRPGPNLSLGLRKKWRSRKATKAGEEEQRRQGAERRATVA